MMTTSEKTTAPKSGKTRARYVKKHGLNNREMMVIHDYFDRRVPHQGWVDVQPIVRDLRAELRVRWSKAEVIEALREMGWFMRVTPRGPYRGPDALISKSRVVVEGEPRPGRNVKTSARAQYAYPQVPGALKQYLDANVAPGSEVEAARIYDRFCAETGLGVIPAGVLTKQLDKSEYSVISTTRWNRRVRMLQRRAA
jgi:hypothetical protein